MKFREQRCKVTAKIWNGQIGPQYFAIFSISGNPFSIFSQLYGVFRIATAKFGIFSESSKHFLHFNIYLTFQHAAAPPIFAPDGADIGMQQAANSPLSPSLGIKASSSNFFCRNFPLQKHKSRQ